MIANSRLTKTIAWICGHCGRRRDRADGSFGTARGSGAQYTGAHDR
jgi:hypothetical protein